MMTAGRMRGSDSRNKLVICHWWSGAEGVCLKLFLFLRSLSAVVASLLPAELSWAETANQHPCTPGTAILGLSNQWRCLSVN